MDLTLAGYMSGAEWYDVEITREGDEGWYNNRSGGEGMLYDEWNADVAGVYTLTAYGYYHLLDSEGNSIQDENGSDIGRDEIGTVTVTVEAPHGDLGEVSVDLPDKVYVGDSLTVHFNETQHAETYSFWVHDGFYEWLTGDSRNGPGDLTIDTRKLPSGVYWVELDVDAPGYNQSHTTLHFALLDHNDIYCSNDNETYFFTISNTDTIQTQDYVHLIAYVPGADGITLYAQRDNEDLEEIAWTEGPGISHWHTSGLPGTYNIYLGADGWPEPVQMATLVVENPNGNLDAPTLIINGNEEGYTVSANTDDPHTVTVTVPKVENGEIYFIHMGPANEGWKFYQEGHHTSKFEGDQIQISITDDQIEPGRMYEVSCEVHARGYTSASINRTFLLQGRQEKTVTLSVEDQAEYWTAMPVRFHAEAAGATAIRVHMNNEWRYFRGNEVDDQFTIWDQDTLFYAFATTDQLPEDDNFNWDDLDLNWSMQSEPVYVFAHTEGPTSVPSMDVPESVTRGDWLVFTINEDGDARQMDVRIFDDDGNEMEFRRLWETGAHQLPTANLEANRDYRIYLCCIQDQHMWNDGPDYWFHVNDPAEGQNQAFFRIDKTDIYPGEPFIPTIYAPGAEQVKIMLGGGIWLECDGDNATNHADWEWFLEEPGVYTFEAYAQYGQETEWIPVNTVTVNVRERIRLARTEIMVDDVVNAAQEINIQISAVEHGYDYILQLHYQGQDENSWLRWTNTSDESENGIITFTIPAGTLEVNRPYWIDCYVSPSGRDGNQYEGSDSSRNILTKDGSATDASIQVSLNGSWDRDNAQRYLIPVNAGFEVMVTPTGNRQPTAIVVRMGDHSEYRFFDGQPIGMSEYQAWPETIYAQAYYGDLSGYDYEDVSWDSLAWGNPSNVIPVRFSSGGNAQPATISFPGLVMAGQDIVIEVTLGENANEAHANLDRNLEGGEEDLVFDDWFGWDQSEGTIVIPSADLECRHYWLYVDNSGEGYENSRTARYVGVVDDPYQSESKLKLPSGLTEIEDEAFEGILADTVIIPAGVNTIGSRAFADSNVRLVVLEGEVNDIAADAFEGSNLWVIYGSGQNASNWAEAFNAVFYEMGN